MMLKVYPISRLINGPIPDTEHPLYEATCAICDHVYLGTSDYYSELYGKTGMLPCGHALTALQDVPETQTTVQTQRKETTMQWLHFPETEVTLNPRYIVRIDHWITEEAKFYRINYTVGDDERVITVDSASSKDDYDAISRFVDRVVNGINAGI